MHSSDSIFGRDPNNHKLGQCLYDKNPGAFVPGNLTVCPNLNKFRTSIASTLLMLEIKSIENPLPNIRSKLLNMISPIQKDS